MPFGRLLTYCRRSLKNDFFSEGIPIQNSFLTNLVSQTKLVRMWIKRDIEAFLLGLKKDTVQPIKVLKGPRQVGKTSLILRFPNYTFVSMDDLMHRKLAAENPSLFLDQWDGPVLLDEATLVPELFPELKRRVDEYKLFGNTKARSKKKIAKPDYWITGSNQTLLIRSIQESLTGRASFFELNTLSVHEIGANAKLSEILLKGGWPELYANRKLPHESYLNDFISTYIERDIVQAAGIERKTAFLKTLQLCSGRIGSLFNASDIARNVGVETTTVQSWVGKLEENGILRLLPPYYNNLSQRWIKTPKVYFEDVAIASRLQGWTTYQPLYVSSYFGFLFENLVFIEIKRFFTNRGQIPKIYFLRNKEQVEVDFLVELPNQRFIAIEVKANAERFSEKQNDLLQKTKLNIFDRWIVVPDKKAIKIPREKVVSVYELHEELKSL
jgi:predicted AAA+ superfamily ATPase